MMERIYKKWPFLLPGRIFFGRAMLYANLFVAILASLFLFAYRTGWLESDVFVGLMMVLVVILPLFAVVVLVFFRRQFSQSNFSELDAVFEPLVEISDSDELLASLESCVISSDVSDFGGVWNRLVAAVDGLRKQRDLEVAQLGVDQYLSIYDSQRLMFVLDSLSDGIILADSVGHIIMANRTCEGKLGRPMSQFAGTSILELFADVESQDILRRFIDSKSLSYGDSFEVSLGGVSSDVPAEEISEGDQSSSQSSDLLETGETVLRVFCNRINDSDKNGDILIALRDITQQKVSETGRDNFIAHISHELRSPLTNIRAYSETLLSDMLLDATAQKDAYNVINEETARLIRIVNDVLNLSRMESGSLALEKGPVVLDRLIRQSVSDLNGSAAAKKITIQTNYHPKMPNIHADREKLVVVIHNILNNAIKYTPEEGTIFVETNIDERNVYIKIADTGYGIAPSEVSRVFEKFYRVDRSETSDVPGTGLGLAISKEIVLLHGGSINIKSELNQGTEFMIKLPLVVTGPTLGPGSVVRQD